MVARGRHMDVAKVRSLADGRAYTGRQALGLGLVDAIDLGAKTGFIFWMLLGLTGRLWADERLE